MRARPGRSAIFPRILAALYGTVVGLVVDVHGLAPRAAEAGAGLAIGDAASLDRAGHDAECPICLFRSQAQSHLVPTLPAPSSPVVLGRLGVLSDWPIPAGRVAAQSRGPPVAPGLA